MSGFISCSSSWAFELMKRFRAASATEATPTGSVNLKMAAAAVQSAVYIYNKLNKSHPK
jgi:hypothetical protein